MAMKVPPVRSRPTPLQLVNLPDFTGGLNTSSDRFEVAENEVMQALNVEFDERGGIRTRRRLVSQTVTGSPTASGSNFFSFGGRMIVLVDGTTSGFSSPLATAPFAFVALVTPNNSWNQYDLNKNYAEINGFGFFSAYPTASYRIGTPAAPVFVTLTNTMTAPTWQDDYGAPSGTHSPAFKVRCSHNGFMFGSGASGAGAVDPLYRLRWSHPQDGGSWRSFDYSDLGGNGEITGLCSVGDQLLIMMTNGVWVLYGSSPESFRPVQISEMGCYVAGGGSAGLGGIGYTASPYGCFFVTSKGPYLYDGQGLEFVGEKIKEVFTNLGSPNVGLTSSAFTPNNVVYGGSADRGLLYVQGLHSTTYYTYVYNPRIKAWSLWRFGDGSYGFGVTSNPPTLYAFPITGEHTNGPGHILLANRPNTATWYTTDNYETAETGVSGSQTVSVWTGWLHAGQPSVRKNWRRPELVQRMETTGNQITMAVYKDYDTSVAAKTLTITAIDSAIDENLRATSLGTARAVSLKLTIPGTDEKWSLSNLLLKFRPKAPRS
jgi:hypothetical protein